MKCADFAQSEQLTPSENLAPKLCRHHKGHAFVKIDGGQIWFGEHGAAETIDAYNRLIAGWLVNGLKLPLFQREAPSDVTVSVLIRDHLEHFKRMCSKRMQAGYRRAC